ncbi:intermembrane transport protein PqiB [Salinisphaera sp. USBA-960]|nr:intermembrane transport protein PqiB [Salifodinibacter halophilus]NNC27106.1 intermembrane transport protein PqiB [Salifodinibacter halophilus]
MTDDNGQTAQLSRAGWLRVSPVWLIPLIAALIGVWLLYDTFANRGPVIKLHMDAAQSIQAGKTQLKVRSVSVGHVTDVSLASDYQDAVITVQMDSDTAKLIGDDSRFWVVKPRVGPQGISGLNTILSGAYLQLRPAGEPSGKRRFKVQDTPPAVPANQPGKSLQLVTSGNNRLSVGDPIVYQGRNVGRLVDSRFSVGKRQTVYKLFIRKPYSKLITDRTQFWMRSGIQFHLGSQGADVQVGSLESMLVGGVTFGVAKGVKAGKPAENGDRFKLYATHNAAKQDRYDRRIKYVMLVDQSVRGLSDGAPVNYRGLRVGTVEKVPFYRNFHLERFSELKIPILIAIEPQRPSLGWTDWSDAEWRQKNRRFFKHGLRATVKSSNLLTGSKLVSLNFDQNAPPYETKKIGKYPVFPSEPSQIASIQKQLSDLMYQLNDLDAKALANQVKGTVGEANKTLKQVHQMSRRINRLLAQRDTKQLPAKLNQTLKQLRTTLEGFQHDSPAYKQLNDTLNRLDQVLGNVAPLSRTLRDQPNALIFGRPEGEDPIPRASH